MYHEYAFGPARLTWDHLQSPHTASLALSALEEGHSLLAADLEGLSDEDLQTPRLTNWGEEWPTWRVIWTMIHHDLWHGGEIGVLRDLYRVSKGSWSAVTTIES